MRKKILLLSYAFTPLSAPESFLNAKLALCLSDFDVDVLTVDTSSLDLGMDGSLEWLVQKTFKNIYRVTPPDWLTSTIFKYLRFFAVFPDRFGLLNHLMFKRATRLPISQYDIIFTWSQWHSIHQVGQKLKLANPGVFWIAHLSDPWADNPFNPKIPGFSLIQRWFERQTFKEADQIHFTSEETIELVRKKYPPSVSSKFVFLPHVYVSSLMKKKVKSDSSEIFIRYMGNFYGHRTPNIFLEAFKMLVTEEPSLLQNVRVEFWGRWIGKRDPFKELDVSLKKYVTFMRPINYIDSLDLMSSTDILLLIDAPFKKSVFFPSKLVDYIGAERPIFAVTPEGTAADKIRQYGGVVVDPVDVNKIKNALRDTLTLFGKSEGLPINKKMVSQYEVKTVSKLYKEALQRLLNN